ncbi:uncharacterized protein C5orf34 homolog [Glandiceps talaboti]
MALFTLPVATQILLFSNDAVEVTYTDGSQLQLSPCGAGFVHRKQIQQTNHPLQELHRVQQRTQFVTSEFRTKVIEALEFRNRFAERPFICTELMNERDQVNVHSDIHHIKWSTHANSKDMVTLQKDSSVSVSSLGGYASLTLAPHKQEFNVRFLAKVSKPHVRNTEVCENRDARRKNCFQHIDSMELDGSFTGILCQRDTANKRKEKELPGNKEEDSVGENSCHGDSKSQSSRNHYIWLVQHHSVASCPSHWKQALDLALSAIKEENNGDVNEELHDCSEEAQSKASVTSDEKTDDVINSAVPTSLPLNCPTSHLHMWSKETFGVAKIQDGVYNVRQEKLKVICTDGIIYRLHWGSRPVVEVYPGDGSIIRSKGPTGCFFTQYWYENSMIEERVYSAENPPPDTTKLQYSLRRLIGTAARLFHHIRHQDSSMVDFYSNCCWKVKCSGKQPTVPVPASILEETKIAELGRFTAYTDGRVRIVFTDRTMLDMKWDFSSRLRKENETNSDSDEQVRQINNDPPHQSLSLPKIRSDQAIPTGACRLLLPNGQYQLVSLHQPCGFAKYISIAKEWAAWVNSSPNERLNFYDSTVHNFNHGRAVASELKKIKTFNCILCYIISEQLQSSDLLENGSASSEQSTTRGLGSMPGNSSTGGAYPDNIPGPAMVRDVLKKMSQTITDIDMILDNKH